jgi:tRNA nucleotidyltransferase (CCA-adding enzyme)
MMSSWTEIRKKVLLDLTPSEAEKNTILSVADEIIEAIDKILRNNGINGKAELHGSVPHDTWIKGQMDLDIFIVLDQYKDRSQLREVLNTIQEQTNWEFLIAFAEHPYLQTQINGYNIDIVPCFRQREGDRIKSATDRTPLHTKWLKTPLKNLGDEVRLLKQFLKTGDMYGAEIKVGGFSGYLCELLIIKYGSFDMLLASAAEWGEQKVIRFDHETRVFHDPLVIYDPVDSYRNVASALKPDVYRKFISAAKAFTETQSERFFSRIESPVETEKLLLSLQDRSLAFIVIEESRAEVPDVLWGMIWKSSNAVERQLKEKGFKVVGSTAWSNNKTRHILVYEVEDPNLPEIYKHYGPEDYLKDNVEQFKEAYRTRANVVDPPRTEGERWFVTLRREIVGIKKVISKLLEDGGRGIGVSQKLAIKILQHHRVLEGAEVKPYLTDGFERHLYKFLRDKPYWDV